MAETRALDGSVAQGREQVPSGNQVVSRIRDATVALGNGDSQHALQIIDQVLAN